MRSANKIIQYYCVAFKGLVGFRGNKTVLLGPAVTHNKVIFLGDILTGDMYMKTFINR